MSNEIRITNMTTKRLLLKLEDSKGLYANESTLNLGQKMIYTRENGVYKLSLCDLIAKTEQIIFNLKAPGVYQIDRNYDEKGSFKIKDNLNLIDIFCSEIHHLNPIDILNPNNNQSIPLVCSSRIPNDSINNNSVNINSEDSIPKPNLIKVKSNSKQNLILQLFFEDSQSTPECSFISAGETKYFNREPGRNYELTIEPLENLAQEASHSGHKHSYLVEPQNFYMINKDLSFTDEIGVFLKNQTNLKNTKIEEISAIKKSPAIQHIDDFLEINQNFKSIPYNMIMLKNESKRDVKVIIKSEHRKDLKIKVHVFKGLFNRIQVDENENRSDLNEIFNVYINDEIYFPAKGGFNYIYSEKSQIFSEGVLIPSHPVPLDKKEKNNSNSRKKITEFSCYLKIERNGISFQSKHFDPFGLQKIKVFDEEELIVDKNNQPTFVRKIYLNSSKDQNIFTFQIKNIQKIIDVMVKEGKLTLLLDLNQRSINNTDVLNNNKESDKPKKTGKANNYELENYVIFISQSTKEILDNFVKYIKNINPTNNNNNIALNATNSNNNFKSINSSDNQVSKKIVIEDSNNNKNFMPTDIRFGKKRKFKELYNQYGDSNKNSLQNNNNNIRNNMGNIDIPLKHQLNYTSSISNKSEKSEFLNYDKILNLNKKQKFEVINVPDTFLYEIFQFLDKYSSKNFCLVNKRIKKIHDGFMENLQLRADTPAVMFNHILERFYNLRVLKFGKGKKIKNEVFKELNANLKFLTCLDISEIDNLNYNSLTKILSKANPKLLTTINICFDLNCLNEILGYIITFAANLEEFSSNSQLINFYLKTQEERETLTNLQCLVKTNSTPYHMLLIQFLLGKSKLKNFQTFLMNFSLIENLLKSTEISTLIENSVFQSSNSFHKSIFSNLKILHLEVIVIRNIKDLSLLGGCENLEVLNIQNILMQECDKNQKYKQNNHNNQDIFSRKLSKINFYNYKIDIEQVERDLNNNYNFINNNLSKIINLNKDENDIIEEANMAAVDLDDDFIEIFIKIFSNLRKLRIINFGEFLNSDILRIICSFCKNIESVTIKSNYISDEDIIILLRKMKLLEFLDLRGSDYIYGSCFIDVEKLPEKLKKIKLSLKSFNFYNLIEFLRKNNIEAHNYI